MTTQRRLVWMLGVVALLAGAGPASAMYTPNPAGRWAPDRFFLAGDFSYNTSKDLDPRGEVKDQVGMFVRPAYSIATNVMVYGRLGFADAKHLDTGFAGGFGIQGAYVLPQAPQWAIGGAFDFMYWDSNASWVEYQFTPAVSYNIPQEPRLTPYAGLMFDFLGSDFDEDKPVGAVFGTNFDPASNVRIDAQVRVVSETGFFLSAGYMFN